MLLNRFLLGALVAVNSVSALPNPDADNQDVEARSILHHCGSHASWSGSTKSCVCHDKGKEYHHKHKKCRCPKGERWHHIERECKKT
ncbi:hypothetical protein LCI18_008242 [Fusarium solani-melongenae]|uniref:Uncharacterized protein n=1 Tax=Fusarium solani subsp. cucurbitae TaxID=2747967 RepID=A0ACD3Z7X8_FUSSC|nr:hypothetical protein LCI18_008242 [Fusarium solani-melongenae]